MKGEVVKGWAWEIHDNRGQWVLCYWLRSSREELVREKRPSPEARAVKVILQKDKP